MLDDFNVFLLIYHKTKTKTYHVAYCSTCHGLWNGNIRIKLRIKHLLFEECIWASRYISDSSINKFVCNKEWVHQMPIKQSKRNSISSFHSISLSGPIYMVQHTETTISRHPTSRPNNGATLNKLIPHNCDRAAWKIWLKNKKAHY